MDEVDIQKARDLRSPYVNRLIEDNERLAENYVACYKALQEVISKRDEAIAELQSGKFEMQYGAVTVSGVHDLCRVLMEYVMQKARIQQLLEAMDREVAARRKYEAGFSRKGTKAAAFEDGRRYSQRHIKTLESDIKDIHGAWALDRKNLEQRVAELEAEVVRLRAGFQVDEQPA